MTTLLLNHLQSFHIGTMGWLLVALCAVIYGLSKSGIKGIAIIAVPIMAFIFGSKASTGIVLPMLIIADVMAVLYYNRHAQWRFLWKIIPWALMGVIIGTWLGDSMDENAFKKMMAIMIVISLTIMVYWERRSSKSVPDSWWFAAIMGVGAGIATMVGNVAGGIFTIYLLAMRLPKDQFIGTGAWFFLIVNTLKVPFHIFAWNTISWKTLMIDIVVAPALALGFLVGVYVIGQITDQTYRKFVLVMTGIAAIIMLFR